jgi:hypothetical protein
VPNPLSRQPSSVPVPTRPAAVQRFSEAKLTKHSGDLSTNGHYFVSSGQLWVLESATDPKTCTKTMDKMKPNGQTYHRWEGSMSFLKDCLHTAEEIMGGKTFSYEKGAIHSQSRDSSKDIGESDTKNKSIASDLGQGGGKVNENADPAAGQAFLIVETDKVKTYPYHAAGVVAVDGTDRVTLEMFAGTTDAKDSERKYPGKFAMYGSGSQSFHDAFKSAFTTPVTIVIKAK